MKGVIKIAVSIFLFISLNNLYAQNQPDIRVDVNKKYDENGNLIEYDSTYTYFYSNSNITEQELDSIMNGVFNYFNFTYPDIVQRHFNTLFFNDSLLMSDFFHNNFFEHRFLLNDPYFQKMMQEMDSIKNSFFYHKQEPQNY